MTLPRAEGGDKMANKRLKKKRRKADGLCQLCGAPLPSDPGNYLVGTTGRGVCTLCLSVAQEIVSFCKEGQEVFVRITV